MRVRVVSTDLEPVRRIAVRIERLGGQAAGARGRSLEAPVGAGDHARGLSIDEQRVRRLAKTGGRACPGSATTRRAASATAATPRSAGGPAPASPRSKAAQLAQARVLSGNAVCTRRDSAGDREEGSKKQPTRPGRAHDVTSPESPRTSEATPDQTIARRDFASNRPALDTMGDFHSVN